MTSTAKIGHNNPPDPIDEIIAKYADVIQEAENWTDGTTVKNKGQMKDVEALTKDMKLAVKDAKAGQKSESAPHFDAHKAAIARWKPTVEDLQRNVDCLVAANAPFKAALLAEQKATERAEWEKVNAARLEAERIASQAAASDLTAQRAANDARQAVIDAEEKAKALKDTRVKGMRKVHKYIIQDHREALNWIAKTDREAVTAFIEEYVRKNHKAAYIDGVKTWIESEAF